VRPSTKSTNLVTKLKNMAVLMFFALPILCFSQFNGVWSPVRSWNTSYDSIGLIEERIELDHTIYSEVLLILGTNIRIMKMEILLKKRSNIGKLIIGKI